MVTWIDSQRKEREAFYRAETFRRMAEAPGDGAKAAVEILREEERIKQIKVREGLKMAGVIVSRANASVRKPTLQVIHDGSPIALAAIDATQIGAKITANKL